MSSTMNPVELRARLIELCEHHADDASLASGLEELRKNVLSAIAAGAINPQALARLAIVTHGDCDEAPRPGVPRRAKV